MMKFRHFLLRIWSVVTRKPVFLGYGVTTDLEVTTGIDPTIKHPAPVRGFEEQVLFFKLREDLGSFEIQKVIQERGDKVKYLLYHVDSGSEFIVPKKWFDFLFEETTSGIVFRSNV